MIAMSLPYFPSACANRSPSVTLNIAKNSPLCCHFRKDFLGEPAVGRVDLVLHAMMAGIEQKNDAVQPQFEQFRQPLDTGGRRPDDRLAVQEPIGHGRSLIAGLHGMA